jgi:hypothetical protein
VAKLNPFAGPQQKTWATTGAAFLTTIIVWVLKVSANIEMPGDVAAAVTGFLAVAASAATSHYEGNNAQVS